MVDVDICIQVDTVRGRTIRLSEEEWRRINEARDLLLRKGYGQLPPEVQENLARQEEFAKGAVVGMGIAALLYLLSKKR